MKLKILKPYEFTNWNDQINNLPGTTIFHTAQWAQVLSESYRYDPTYVTAFQDNQISGLFPIMDVKSIITGRRGISLPFTDECTPVCEEKETFERIWEKTKSIAKKRHWKFLEIRGSHPTFREAPTSSRYLWHHIDLFDDPREQMATFRDSTIRNIKKSKNSGVKIYRNNSNDSVCDFYRLNCMTRKRHGLPPQPLKFLKNILEYLLTKNMGHIFIAKYQGKPIASILVLAYKKSLLYKFSASDLRHQGLRANNLLIWEAIKYGIQKGYTRFDFGRSEMTNNGLLQFKRGWGTMDRVVRYHFYDTKAENFGHNSGEIKSSYLLFKMLPIPILKLSGRLLYRHVG